VQSRFPVGELAALAMGTVAEVATHGSLPNRRRVPGSAVTAGSGYYPSLEVSYCASCAVGRQRPLYRS
jgi:hypothetical protein